MKKIFILFIVLSIAGCGTSSATSNSRDNKVLSPTTSENLSTSTQAQPTTTVVINSTPTSIDTEEIKPNPTPSKEWKEVIYPEFGFSISAPANWRVVSTTNSVEIGNKGAEFPQPGNVTFAVFPESELDSRIKELLETSLKKCKELSGGLLQKLRSNYFVCLNPFLQNEFSVYYIRNNGRAIKIEFVHESDQKFTPVREKIINSLTLIK